MHSAPPYIAMEFLVSSPLHFILAVFRNFSPFRVARFLRSVKIRLKRTWPITSRSGWLCFESAYSFFQPSLGEAAVTKFQLKFVAGESRTRFGAGELKGALRLIQTRVIFRQESLRLDAGLWYCLK